MFLLSPGDPVSRLREQGKGTRAGAILTNDTQLCRHWWILNGDIVSVEQVPGSQRVHFFLCYVFFFFFFPGCQGEKSKTSQWVSTVDWPPLNVADFRVELPFSPQLVIMSNPELGGVSLAHPLASVLSWLVWSFKDAKILHSSLQSSSITCSWRKVWAARAWGTWRTLT